MSGEIAAALDLAHDTGDFFQDFKKGAWNALNSYTHGGMLQLGRRFTKHDVANNYSERGIYGMTTTLTTCVLILISRFLARQGHASDAKEVDELLRTFGPWSEVEKETT